MFRSSERCIAASRLPCHSGSICRSWHGYSLCNFRLSFRKFHCSPQLRRTHYEALGVSPGASLAQIKSAYYQQSKLLHPDNAATLDPKEQLRLHNAFVELNKAYEVLRRSSTRKEYDEFLSEGISPGGTYFRGSRRPPNRPAGPYDNSNWYQHWHTANHAYYDSFRSRPHTPPSKMEKQFFTLLFLLGILFLYAEITRLVLFNRRRKFLMSVYSKPYEESFKTQGMPVHEPSTRAYSTVPGRTGPAVDEDDVAKQWLETIKDYDQTQVCMLTGEKI